MLLLQVLTCPFILLNLNSTGAVSKVATVPFITLTWLLLMSPCKPNFAAISAFRYVCVLPSSNRAFMIKLLLPFSTMTGTVCNEIHPSFWHFVATNDVFCCSSPSMRDVFDCCAGFCSTSSSWLALCNILLYFFKLFQSILQVDPQLHSATFWPPKQQKHNLWIFTVAHVCSLFIFLNMSHCQTLCFFPQILQYPKAVFAWYVLQSDHLFVSSNVNCFISHCLIFWLHYYPLPQCFHRWLPSLFVNPSLILCQHYLRQFLL